MGINSTQKNLKFGGEVSQDNFWNLYFTTLGHFIILGSSQSVLGLLGKKHHSIRQGIFLI